MIGEEEDPSRPSLIPEPERKRKRREGLDILVIRFAAGNKLH